MRPTSILDGADSAIDRWLGVEKRTQPGQYRLKSVARRLRGRPRKPRDAAGLISVVLCLMGKNLEESRYDGSWDPPRGNWRLRRRPLPPVSPQTHPEAALERRIVSLWPRTWTNQISTAAGLCGPRSDLRRCIDLVHYEKPSGEFAFYELKWKSDTPLMAAMEILQYGAIYIFCRYLLLESPYAGAKGDLLRAKVVHLRTLAPSVFYRDADLKWLEDAIRSGLHRFLDGESRLDLQMDFAFEAFPGRIRWRSDLSRMPEKELTKALNGRYAVYATRPNSCADRAVPPAPTLI